MASSGVWTMAQPPPARIAATSTTIRNGLRALNSMTRAIMGRGPCDVEAGSVLHVRTIHTPDVLRLRLTSLALHTAHVHAGHARHAAATLPKPTLRVDQEVGRGDHPVAFVQPLEDLEAIAELHLADLHFHRHETVVRLD